MRDSDDFADEMRLPKLYEEGRRLFLVRKFEHALDRFKRVYETDSGFRDVAEIVEDAYCIPETEWRKKYQIRFSMEKDQI